MADKIIEQDEIRRFKDALGNAFGETIKKPFAAKLGFQNADGERFIEVPSNRTDQPNKFYFHEAGGTSYQGEAFMQPGALKDWQIMFGTPIRIKRDPLSKEWEITALDSRYAQQFFDGVTQDDTAVYGYNKLAPGLLTTTIPISMQAKVLFGAYRLGDVFKYVPTITTIDWSVSPYNTNIPTSPLQARLVLVQVNYDDGILEYKYGDTFPSPLSFSQIITLDANTGTYIPQADAGKFRAGFIRLNYGIIEIKRDNIIPLQEYLAIQSPNAGQNALDTIITWGGDVVVDSISGSVVYTRIEY